MTAGYLTNGDTYQFKVTTINLSGESGPSNVVTATPRSADGASAYSDVTSSWILNNLGEFSAIQRYDGAMRPGSTTTRPTKWPTSP